MYRDTNPFSNGPIKQIYYCAGRTYKTIGGANKLSAETGAPIYLVKMTYELVVEPNIKRAGP